MIDWYTRWWWCCGRSWLPARGRAFAVGLIVPTGGALGIPGRPSHVMLLDICLELLEQVFESLDPVNMLAVLIPELHEHLYMQY